MAVLKQGAVLALLLALNTSCVGRMVNTATVYQPVTGVVQMEIKLPAGEAVAKVQFQVNDKVVSEDDSVADGYTAEIDTADLESDTLAKLAAVGVRADGSTVVLRENFILVTRPADEVDAEPIPTTDNEGEDPAPEDDGEDAVGGSGPPATKAKATAKKK